VPVLAAALFAGALGGAPLETAELRLASARIGVEIGVGADSLVVVEGFTIDAGRPVASLRIEHTLRDAGESPIEATVEGGRAEVTERRTGPLRHVVVELYLDGEPRRLLAYQLSFRSRDATADFVPLIVPSAPTDGVGRPVGLTVHWPEDRELVGFPLPRASGASGIERRMAAVPALLRIPLGRGGRFVWLSRHGIDLVTLAMVIAALLAGARYRRRWEW
jgi:hypothetical protein